MKLEDAIQHYTDQCLSEAGKPSNITAAKDTKFLERGSTAKSIRSDLINFQNYSSGRKTLESITSAHIEKYLANQTSRSSAYRRLYSLRKFCKYCESRGWITKGFGLGRSLLPSKEILPYLVKKCEDRPTEAEIGRLLSTIQDPLSIDPEGFIAVSLLLSGLKSNEVLSITLESLLFQKRGSSPEIIIEGKMKKQPVKGKKASTKEHHRIPLTKRVDGKLFQKYLKMLISRREQDGSTRLLRFNRNSLPTYFSTVCQKAGIRPFHPRDLRLQAMVDLKENGYTNEMIAASLGVTAEYVRREIGCE
jgi:integrase